jgi:hypothetical protein
MACITPYTISMKTGNKIDVPCGKCPECLTRRVSSWSFRLMQEDKRSISSHFITLTYDTKNVPITRRGFKSLEKADLQKFFKRLRKWHEKTPGRASIKYYAVGEYGSKTKRPHYHIILFNAELAGVEHAWQLGSIDVGTVTGASIGYVMKYISKPQKIPAHRNDDRGMGFSVMSKGLGENYVTDAIKRWHHADIYNRMNIVIEDGKIIAMPRYYKDRIYEKEKRQMIGRHQAKVRELENAILEKQPGYTRRKVEADKAAFEKLHSPRTDEKI